MYWARKVAVNTTFAPMPGGAFSPVNTTIYPAWYRPGEGDKYMLSLLGLQWWVSPNLALEGGVGDGVAGKYIVSFRRVGLRYLPASLSWGPFAPEFYFAQNKVTGLNPSAGTIRVDHQGNEVEFLDFTEAYDTKWNEIGWRWTAQLGHIHWAGSAMRIYQRTYVSGGRKLDLNFYLFMLSAGYDVFRWLRLSVQVKANPNFATGGVQLSLAI